MKRTEKTGDGGPAWPTFREGLRDRPAIVHPVSRPRALAKGRKRVEERIGEDPRGQETKDRANEKWKQWAAREAEKEDGEEKVEKATPENLLEDLSKQTFILAEIINEKFRVLKISVRIIIYGVIPLLATSLLLLILEGVK